MKSTRRDRALIATAVVLVVVTASLVLTTVLKAANDGTKALQDLQSAQVQQLARGMDSRIASTYQALAGLATPNPAWNLTVNDPSDATQLAKLQGLNPKARTGFYLVRPDGTITNGTLLRDPKAIGSKYAGPTIAAVLAGAPAILPVSSGITTTLPVVIIAFPLRSPTGQVIGAMLIESDVSVDSAFNAEVAQLKPGRTGEFTFVDENGVVVSSSNVASLGKPLDEPLLKDGKTGLRTVNGKIIAIEPVKSAGWRAVFRQDVDEFQGALTDPLYSALAYVIVAAILAAGVAVVTLGRRLRRAREEQRRLEEINAVREEFISIVSHELRTPVAGMLGFLQTTLDHWDVMSDGERQRAITRAMSSARRLHSLTRDVLDTSAIEAEGMSFTMAEMDLRDSVSSAVVAERDLRPDRLISLELPDTETWVRCDPDRIQQVITNLLDNAVKSSPPLTPIEITLRDEGDSVAVEVRDHGPGLSDAELTRVFDKFVRGRTSTPTGTGLGLYICRQIIEAQGGSIHAERGDDGGARFVFTLPRVDAPAEPVGA